MLAFPVAGMVRDPMSGFFALRREVLARACELNPVGFKIALELLCKCKPMRVHEVPIRFGLRLHGDSKLSAREQYRYLSHLRRLYQFRFPRLVGSVRIGAGLISMALSIEAMFCWSWPAAGVISSGLGLAGYLAVRRAALRPLAGRRTGQLVFATHASPSLQFRAAA
jgi:hypothetical protein